MLHRGLRVQRGLSQVTAKSPLLSWDTGLFSGMAGNWEISVGRGWLGRQAKAAAVAQWEAKAVAITPRAVALLIVH